MEWGRGRARSALRIAWPALGAVLAYAIFFAIGRGLQDYRLDLGSQTLPHPREAYFVLLWGFFGTAGAALLALSLTRLGSLSATAERALRLLPETRDATWIAFLGLAAFIVPLAIRMLLLDGASVADDESCYHFGGELVASGRLTAPSPPMKLFFDRTFMVNDGRLYPMYFMGWPILMAPGVKLGVGGYMNAVYAALTVPALFFATRRLAGSIAARACAAFFVASPMLMIGAATEMSNTSCFAALAWMLASYVEARDDSRTSLLPHAGVALFFGVAVLVRPPSAIGAALPVLVAWIAAVLRGRREARLRRVVAFAVPAAAAAALFLSINKIQNGSFFLVSYIREFQYAKENGLRFNNWGVPGLREWTATLEPHFSHLPSLDQILAVGGVAFLRLNYNLFGWFPSLLFVPFAQRRDGASLLFWMVGCYFVAHYGIDTAGIDVYGPHHYVEVTLPLVMLSALGVGASARWLHEHVPPQRTPWKLELYPGALAVALAAYALVGYDPPRARALLAIARDVNFARDTLADRGVHHAVVFSPRPFTAHFAQCREPFGQHFVYWRPNNDPDLTNDVLWVNHVSLAEDAKFMTLFPDRAAYVYFFNRDCDRVFVPLGEAAPGSIPDGDVDGDNRGIVGALRSRDRARVK